MNFGIEEPPVDPNADTQEFPVSLESQKEGEILPKDVQVLIFDPNPPEDGIDGLVKAGSEKVGRTAKIVKTKEELVNFLSQLYVDGKFDSRLNLLVINSGSVARGKIATEMDTQQLIKPWLDMANEIVEKGQVVDENGKVAKILPGIELMFIAPRDRDRLEGALSKAVQLDRGYVVNRIQPLGMPFDVEKELISYLDETIPYTLKLGSNFSERPTEAVVPITEPPVNTGEDTV